MYHFQKRILEEAKKYANADTKSLSESAMKAALEDYLYSIPKTAIDELRPVMKMKPSTQRMAKITAILKKHGFTAKFMGAYPAAVVQDYYDTFFGESVEVDGEQLSEAQEVVGKYRFTSFTEGSLSGWTISVQGVGEVGFIEAPAKKNTKSSVAPHKIFKTKGQPEGNPKLVLTAYPDSSTRLVNDKEIRFGPRQLFKAIAMWMDKYGKVMTEDTRVEEEMTEANSNIKKVGKPTKMAGMVVQDYEYNGKKYMALHSFSGRETVIKMITPQGTVEVWRKSGNIQPDEAMRQYVTSSDFKEGVEVNEIEEATSIGKVMKAAKKSVLADRDGRNTPKAKAAMAAYKTAAKNHLNKEEVEVNETWYDSPTLSKKDADSLLDDLESAYKKGGLRGQFKVPNGDSGPVWEMIQGLTDFLRGEPKNMVAYVLKGVKDFLSATDRNDSRIKKVFESFSTEGDSILENAYAAREAQAKEIADKIKQVARERGVRVYGEGRVLTATKEFPKGDMQAFHKAYNDCHAVVTHMRFTKNSNEWGCSSAGFGVGAQECVKAGRVTINKSGDGGSLILKKL